MLAPSWRICLILTVIMVIATVPLAFVLGAANAVAVGHDVELRRAAELGDKIALAELRAAARSGRATAENELGLYYYSKHQYAHAFGWYAKSAASGYASAEYNLAWLYFMGRGTKRDDVLARAWFEKLAARWAGGIP